MAEHAFVVRVSGDIDQAKAQALLAKLIGCGVADAQATVDNAAELTEPGELDAQLALECEFGNPEPLGTTLPALKENGLSFSDCIAAFAAPEGDPYVTKLRSLVAGDDDTEVDERAVVAPSGGGAFVQAWIWVGNEEAGMLKHADLLEQVLDHARNETDTPTEEHAAYADWLEDLITNFADELDDIEHEVVTQLPGSITWIDEAGKPWTFMASAALFALVQQARLGVDGLSVELTNQADNFCRQYGNKLDAMLRSFYTAELTE